LSSQLIPSFLTEAHMSLSFSKQQPSSLSLKPRKGTARHRWHKEELTFITGLANEGKAASYITEKLNEQFKASLSSNQVGKKLGRLRAGTSSLPFLRSIPAPDPRSSLLRNR
jgi:hypothetical protein